jgi:hypothetical protein
MNGVNKYSTDTDMFFDLLADPNKLKPVEAIEDPNLHSDDADLIDQANINSISEPEFQDNFSEKPFINSLSDSPIKSEKKKVYTEQKINEPKNHYPSIFGNLLDDYDKLNEKGKRLKRMEIFSKLINLQTNFNVKLSRSYNIDSDYHEMVAELKFHNDVRSKINTVSMAKNILFNVIGCLELANSRYDPFGFYLDGWSDHLKSTNEETLTDILGELYEKYKVSQTAMSPEVKLLLVLVGSATQFHLIQSAGMKELVDKNPEIAKGINNMFTNTVIGERKLSDSELEKKIKSDLFAQMQKLKNQPLNNNNFGTNINDPDDDYLNNQQKILEKQIKNRINNDYQTSEIEVSSVRPSNNNRISETINSDSVSNSSDLKYKSKKTKSRSKIKIET